MVEISLHILDIVQNSIKANASSIKIDIDIDTLKNYLKVEISDNGSGMTDEFLKEVINPFCTSRTTRKVGLGIPLFKNACEQTGGSFEITSKLGEGTKVIANFVFDSIDRQPLGDMASTILCAINTNDAIDYVYHLSYNGNDFTFDTIKIRQTLGDEIPLSETDVLLWIEDYIKNETYNICGGAYI